MAETHTANYGWTKPDVGVNTDTWGDELNADLDAIDAIVHSISIGGGGSLTVNGVPGITNLNFAGAGVSVASTAPNATVTIPGGGGGSGSPTTVARSTNASTSPATVLTAADISGGSFEHTLVMTAPNVIIQDPITGVITPLLMQLPTVASLVAALGAVAGQSYKLRVRNLGFASWTITTNTGWTPHGLMEISPNSTLEFYVIINTLTTATLEQQI